MNEIIYNVLNSIENMGYKSYIVGGYVRDFIWNINSNDVDICTNAPSSVIIDLFKEYKPKLFKYDSVKFNINAFHFDISRIRREVVVNNRTVVEYTDNLFDDYSRRDFTFNAIYMNKLGHIITYDSSYTDCVNKEIRFINNSFDKINEDPSRLLRYVYFVMKYNLDYTSVSFDVHRFKKFIKEKSNAHIVNYYVGKILKSKHGDNLYKVLNDIGIYRFLNTFLIDWKIIYI